MYLAEMASSLSPAGQEAAKELRLLLNSRPVVTKTSIVHIPCRRFLQRYLLPIIEITRNIPARASICRHFRASIYSISLAECSPIASGRFSSLIRGRSTRKKRSFYFLGFCLKPKLFSRNSLSRQSDFTFTQHCRLTRHPRNSSQSARAALAIFLSIAPPFPITMPL